MTEENNGRIYSDTNSYILDWLTAKPAPRPQTQIGEVDEEKRINTIIAMLSRESGGADNVVPFKSRKK